MTKPGITSVASLLVAGVCGMGLQAAPEGKEPVNFSVEARGEYTDNRDAVETGEESNFDLYVSPRIDVYLDAERTLVNMYYVPSFRYRSDPSAAQNDTELFHDFGVNVDSQVSPNTALRLREKFDYNDDPSVEEGGFTVREDRTYIMNRATVGVRRDFNRRTYGDLSVHHMLKAYDDSEIAANSDEDELGANVLVWRQMTPQDALTLNGAYTAYGFDSATDLNRDFNVAKGAVGLEHVFSPELRGGVDLGAQAVDYDDGTLDGEVYPFGRVSATLAPTPATRLDGSFEHGVRDSDVFPFAAQEYSELFARLEKDVSALVTFGVSGLYRLSEYDGDKRPAGAPITPFAESGDETTIVLTAYGTWTLSSSARVKVFHRFEDIDSDVEVSYTKNTTSAALLVDL